jgi:hypothetical protein
MRLLWVLGIPKSLGLMILLARLKFCWCIINIAGPVFEVKVVPAKDPHKQNSAGARKKILSVCGCRRTMITLNVTGMSLHSVHINLGLKYKV